MIEYDGFFAFVLNHDFNKIIRISKINPVHLVNLVKILVQTITGKRSAMTTTVPPYRVHGFTVLHLRLHRIAIAVPPYCEHGFTVLQSQSLELKIAKSRTCESGFLMLKIILNPINHKNQSLDNSLRPLRKPLRLCVKKSNRKDARDAQSPQRGHSFTTFITLLSTFKKYKPAAKWEISITISDCRFTILDCNKIPTTS